MCSSRNGKTKPFEGIDTREEFAGELENRLNRD
jgi:hypothetical protein